MAAEESGAGYDAFLSYSHALDGRLAPALQQGLQGFARPWYRRRVLRIFRDQTNLTASPALWPSIENALESSRYLLVLASPESAASQWVRAEVHWWLEHRSADRILVVTSAGDISWDAAVGRFRRTADSALPPELEDAFAQEPLWVDLRWARDAGALDLRNAAFANAVADLSAPLRGVSKDELVGEDLKQHRRTRRVALLALSVILSLALLASTAAVVADRARQRAEDNARTATARLLASSATRDLRDRIDLAALEAAAGYAVQPSPETRSALFQVALASPWLSRFHTLPVRAARVVMTRDDRQALVGGVDGSLWSVELDGGAVRSLPGLTSEVSDLRLSDDDQVLEAANLDDERILVSLPSGRRLAESPSPFSPWRRPERLDDRGRGGSFSPNGQFFAHVVGSEVVLLRTSTGRRLATLTLPAEEGAYVPEIVLDDAGHRVVVLGGASMYAFSVTSSGDATSTELTGVVGARAGAFGSGGRLVTTSGSQLQTWELDTLPRLHTVLATGRIDGQDTQSVDAVTGSSPPFVWSSDHRSTRVTRNGTVQELAGNEPVFTSDGGQAVTHLYDAAGGTTLALWSWDGSRYRQVRRQSAPSPSALAVSFTTGGSELVLADPGENELHRIATADGHRLSTIAAPGYTPDSGLAVSEDGQFAAMEHEGNAVEVVSVLTGSSRLFWAKDRREVTGGITSIALNEDASVLAAVLNGRTLLWDTATGQELGLLDTGRAQDVQLLSRLDLLVGVQPDGAVGVWELRSRRWLGSLVLPSPTRAQWRRTGDDFQILASSPGDQLLVLLRDTGQLVSLDTNADHWSDAVCRLAGQTLSEDRWSSITGQTAPADRGC